MSNAAYSGPRYRRVPASQPHAAESNAEQPREVEEEEAYDEGADVAEPSGLGATLFSTPARTITLVFSILLLFAVVGMIAWVLGQSGKAATNEIGIGAVSS